MFHPKIRMPALKRLAVTVTRTRMKNRYNPSQSRCSRMPFRLQKWLCLSKIPVTRPWWEADQTHITRRGSYQGKPCSNFPVWQGQGSKDLIDRRGEECRGAMVHGSLRAREYASSLQEQGCWQEGLCNLSAGPALTRVLRCPVSTAEPSSGSTAESGSSLGPRLWETLVSRTSCSET